MTGFRGRYRSGPAVLAVLAALTGAVLSPISLAETHRVPEEHETLQAAVDAALPGDRVLVRAGTYCGAAVDKPLHLSSAGGAARVVGCSDGPTVFGRGVGFLLSGAPSSAGGAGIRIEGFSIDGVESGEPDTLPLSFGIFSRFVHDVSVVDNRFVGLLQPITNTAGDRWLVSGNVIEDLPPVDCAAGCRGGVGIAILSASARDAATRPAGENNRPEGNRVIGNRVSGGPPAEFSAIGRVGVLLVSSDLTGVRYNRVDLASNPTSDAPGRAIVVTNVCCGDPAPIIPGNRRAILTMNDARTTEIAVHVQGSGQGDLRGDFLFGNAGRVIVNGMEHRALTIEPLAAEPVPPRPFR